MLVLADNQKRIARGMAAAGAALDAACEWPELEVLERRRADDGFLKYLFKLPDGREIEAPAGTLVIEAAKQAGIEIPSFCYYEGYSLQAACR